MIDLKTYYNARVASLEPSEYLKQVGHTLGGVPISDSEFNYLIADIKKGLDLSSRDVLLDLCCGNGTITKQLSDSCYSISAIDLSEKMISIAKQYNNPNNISYIHGDVRDINKFFGDKKEFSKVLMFAALQHFNTNDLVNLIRLISSVSSKEFSIFLGFIPDAAKKWIFYNSIKKRIAYFQRKLTKSDIMGTWWHRQYIANVCSKEGFTCNFINIPEGRYGYAYRFHVIIRGRT